MIVPSLDTLNYRNLADMRVEFSPGFNVIYGENAQGKSNVLEAIYALAFLKSFREEKTANLIRFGAQRAQLGATVIDGARQTRLGAEFGEKSRKAYADGAPCARFGDYLGILRAILFVPSDVAILQTPPLARRSMLDRMVFTLHPSYLIPLMRYQKAVKQKSALLKSENPDTALLDAYDEQMRVLGCALIRERMDYMRLLQPYIATAFSSIFGEDRCCSLGFKSSSHREEVIFGSAQPVPGADEICASFEKSLSGAREKELLRGQVSGGPHRDDWTLYIDDKPARHFASQGQQRALCIALKIAEILCLKNEAQIEPILLLDDISSELDPIRHRNLFAFLNRLSGQIFLTTTSKSHVHIESIGRLFKIERGVMQHEVI